MARITAKQLKEAVERLEKRTDLTVELESTAGRWAIYKYSLCCDTQGKEYKRFERRLSPMLSAREMVYWVDAFIHGQEENQARIRSFVEKWLEEFKDSAENLLT